MSNSCIGIVQLFQMKAGCFICLYAIQHSLWCFMGFLNGPSRPLFIYFRLFNTVDILCSIQILPTMGLEPRTSSVGSDHSTNWTTTTAQHFYDVVICFQSWRRPQCRRTKGSARSCLLRMTTRQTPRVKTPGIKWVSSSSGTRSVANVINILRLQITTLEFVIWEKL